MVCLAPRAPGDSVRPRRLSGVVARPLNFTVRWHVDDIVSLAPVVPLMKSRVVAPSQRF